jgi:hypothetical protein
MKTRVLLVVISLLFALGTDTVRSATVTWTNTSGGNWSNTNNWSPNQAPGAADTAVIAVGGNYSVSLDVSPTVAGLVLGGSSAGTTQSFFTAGQTLAVNGPIQVNAQGQFNLDGGALGGTNVLVGTLTWSGGDLAGVSTLASNSVLNIVAGGGNGFDGLVLTNYGTVNWTNATLVGLGGRNAQIYNYGLWDAQSDNTFQGQGAGGTTLFENFGTFLKSGNTGTTILDAYVVFNNSGTVNVQSGTLDFEGGGTSSGGGFTTAGGASINFISTAYNFTNSTTFSGNGNFVAGGATFGGTIAGTLNWDGGNLGGAATLTTNSVLNIGFGSGSGGFNGLVLTNYGTVNWSNGNLVGVNERNAQIYNYGLWNAQGDNTFLGQGAGGTTLFDNFGTFRKSGNAGTTILDANVVFNNTGTVNVESGTLDIGGGTSSGGDFTTTGGAAINFISTAYNFGNSTTFAGTGSFVTGGATFGGTIAGTLGWGSGSLSGVLTVASNSVFDIVFAGGNGAFNGLVLTNYGTVNWTNTTLVGVNGRNAQIYNYGVWNAQSDNTFQGQGAGGTTLFENFGTFRKSGNTGTTILDGNVVFNNTGTVNVGSGTLDIQGGGINSGGGTFTTANGGLLNLDGIIFANSATISSSTVVGLGGDTTIIGALTAANLQLVSGTLSGTNVLIGTLTWSGGDLAGVLTLASNSVLNIVAGSGHGFDGLVLTNYGTVNWTNATLVGLGGHNAQIYNYGLWNAQGDNSFQGQAAGGTTLFENFGTFLKSGNTGTTILDAYVVFNNSGTVNAESGTLSLEGNYNLTGGTLSFGINNQTNYGAISLAGAAALTGAVSVSFNNGFVPAAGSQFQVLSCASLTGTFNTADLPFGLSSVYSTKAVTLVWNGITQASWAAGNSALHGTSTFTFLDSPGTTVQLVASATGVSYLLGATATGGIGTISFNTAQLSNGLYSLQAGFYNAAGQAAGDFSRTVFVNNSLDWHEGTLSASQTWGTNAVNAVDQTIIIPSGVTLIIAPGAIVKFAQGTGIIIQAGGILDAGGATAGAPIIFTSLADDSAGGDSNEDGDDSVPVPGDWNGITVVGQFSTSDYVQIRYVIQTPSGTLSGNQEWFGSIEYVIGGNLTIPTNVTLRIDPGAIVKFDLGVNLTAESGGTLIATGTVAQPIVFTSVNDESVGANTSGVPTTPQAGDWDSIYLKGGQATFDHVAISYGGGPDSIDSGLISLIAPNSVLSVSDSILSQGFYKGIQAQYGTANVTNCLISGCDRGIQSGLSGPTVVNIVNCTLDDNNVGLLAHGGVMNVANTIVSDSLTIGVQYCCGSALALFEYCDVWSPTGVNYSGISDQTGANGSISADPKFVNAAQGNYELNYGSPCINAADGAVAPLTDLTGAPCYNDPRTPIKTGVANASGLYPDMGAFEFVETASSPVDLIVNSVSGPLAETAGQTVAVQWSDVNIGSGNAIGPWHDTVSLVPQNGGDTLVVATVLVAQNVVLGPGQSYLASASVVVPGGQEGAWQWQVHVNSQGDVFEGVNWTNNITLAPASSTLSDPTLTIGGTSVTNVLTAAGQSSVFALASAGGTFVVNVQGSTAGGTLELFVGDGYVPDPSHFDFQSSQFNSPTASVTVPSNNNDTYYVVVYAASLGASAVSYTLWATQLGFALNSVSPASMADSGPVTLQIQGDGLAANDSYTLAGPGGAFGASSVQSPDPTVAYATFNLAGAAAGLYSLQVGQPAGQTLTLTNAISALSRNNVAAAASLSIQLELPPAYRQSRPFDGTIVYRDAGDVDLPAPILILTSGGVAGMALQGSTSYLTNDLVLIGASFEGPAGTLTPGKSWSIAFGALGASETTIPLAVNYKTADASDLIDYSTLEPSLRPPGYSDTNCWNEIWTKFQAEAGPTWGGFVSLMDSYSTEMALTRAPGTFYLLQDVLAYAFGQLAGTNCPPGLASSPAPAPPNPNPGPSQTVPNRRSGDPNDKFATGIGLPEWVAGGDAITYTIQFENETNAGAPAQTVAISDPLAGNLDWSTLQLGAIGFNDVIIEIPPGVQTFSTNVNVGTDPNPVAVSASLNPAGGVVSWLMESIDPVTGQLVTDPLAGFLPPDNVQGQGEGYVIYTIEPRSGLATGTQITNQASIVFDLNAAIVTPITTNTVDVTPPASSMAALPANPTSIVPVSWSGYDAGSGIAGFDIYVSTNGGPWTPWLLGTTNTSAKFTGVPGNTYALYSVATDEVGNVEASPQIPGAETTIASSLAPLLASPSLSDGQFQFGVLATSGNSYVIQASTNLVNWLAVQTNVAPFVFADPNYRHYPWRWYRAVLAP